MIDFEFYTVKQLCERYSVQPITIRRWIADGIFPPPLRIGRRRCYWPVSIVEKFEAEAAKVAGHDSQTTPQEARP